MYLPLIAALICAAGETPAPAVAAPADAAEAAPPRAEKPRKKKGKPPMEGVLNVNRASTAELRLLPGIGRKPATASNVRPAAARPIVRSQSVHASRTPERLCAGAGIATGSATDIGSSGLHRAG